jgi:hypothetical protein
MSNDSNNRLPLYAQVENVIIGRISNGSLPPGTRLPSEESSARIRGPAERPFAQRFKVWSSGVWLKFGGTRSRLGIPESPKILYAPAVGKNPVRVPPRLV